MGLAVDTEAIAIHCFVINIINNIGINFRIFIRAKGDTSFAFVDGIVSYDIFIPASDIYAKFIVITDIGINYQIVCLFTGYASKLSVMMSNTVSYYYIMWTTIELIYINPRILLAVTTLTMFNNNFA